MAFSKARRLADLMSAGSASVPASKRALADDAVTSAKIADNAIITALIADGAITGAKLAAGVGGGYNSWSVKTGTYTAASRDQLIANSGSAFTITLPSSPSAGNSITIHNAGAGTVTIGRNSSNIESTADDGELTTGKSTQLVYIDSTIGWKEV